jgi:hypothetical protein
MLHHLSGLLDRAFNSQVTGAKPLQVHIYLRCYEEGVAVGRMLTTILLPKGNDTNIGRANKDFLAKSAMGL